MLRYPDDESRKSAQPAPPTQSQDLASSSISVLNGNRASLSWVVNIWGKPRLINLAINDLTRDLISSERGFQRARSLGDTISLGSEPNPLDNFARHTPGYTCQFFELLLGSRPSRGSSGSRQNVQHRDCPSRHCPSPPTYIRYRKNCVISALLPVRDSYQRDRQASPLLRLPHKLVWSGLWAPLGRLHHTRTSLSPSRLRPPLPSPSPCISTGRARDCSRQI